MEFWKVLDIPRDADEREIKKAYRVKLKQHHPEDDPEGFKQVRQAYEHALDYQKNHVDQVEPSDEVDIPNNEPAIIFNSQHTPSAIEELVTILNHGQKRFDQQSIAKWIKKIQLIPLDEFEALSQQVIDEVLSRRWLPGEIVESLYHCFDWSLLLNAGENKSRLGEFLKEWSEQRTGISLSDLNALCAAEQRSLLSFVRPLNDALDDSILNAVKYLLTQPNQLNITTFKVVKLKICLCYQAGGEVAPSVMNFIVTNLLEKYTNELSVEELTLLGRCSLKLNNEALLQTVLKRLYTLNAHAEYCELNYQNNKSVHTDAALCYAFLRQQLWPRSNAYWYAELHYLKKRDDNNDAKRQNWIANTLKGNLFTVFSLAIELHAQSGFFGDLMKAFWSGTQGNWKDVIIEIDRLQQLSATNTEQEQLIDITIRWLQTTLAKRSGTPSLISKLEGYGEQGWFYQEEITTEELHSMNKDEWHECIVRHPLLPESWVLQLISENIINEDFVQNSEKLPDSVYRLYHVRYYNHSFDITDPWYSINPSCEDYFQWIQVYYAQGTVHEKDYNGLLEHLPPLPELLENTIFTPLAEFLAQPERYLPETVARLEKFSDLYISKYLTNNQIRLLFNSDEIEPVYDLAKKGDGCAYMALSWKLEKEHIDEAIIYWNLCATSCVNKPQFSYSIDWQQESLADILNEKNLALEEYQYSEANFIRAFLTTNKEWFSKPEELYDVSPEKEAKPFYFPMSILLTHLHLGLNKDGYEFEQLKELYRKRKLQSELQQATTDIAVLELERMYQGQLEKDISSKKAITRFSKSRNIWSLVFVMTVPFIFGGLEVALDLNGFGALGILVFFIANFAWSKKAAKGMTPGISKKTMFGYIYVLLALTVFHGTFFFAHLFALFYCTRNISPLYANGSWEGNVLKSQKVDMLKILGAPKKMKT